MSRYPITRRRVMVDGASAIAGILLPEVGFGKNSGKEPAEVELTDEPTRGSYGIYDVANFGPAVERKVKDKFVFPKDVETDWAYGIDISHHTTDVPWTALKSAKVSYIYLKASQSRNGRDGKFVKHWGEAEKSGLPFGAYHFLTAGVNGRDQGGYFLKRLSEVKGFRKGQLQPVIDLEWDTFGPDFKRVVIGTKSGGEKIYKDYWDRAGSKPGKILPRSDIVATVNDCVSAIRAAAGNLAIRPIIYTNRSWWESHIPSGTVFADCSIWISDYREISYHKNSPRSVQGHDYYLWQFSDKGRVNVGETAYGPFDCNKLMFGGLNHITIA